MKNFNFAEYVYYKFFFVIVVVDCLLVVRLVPALIAYKKTTTYSIKVYLIYKIVTFFLHMGGTIFMIVWLWYKIRQSKIEQTVELEF